MRFITNRWLRLAIVLFVIAAAESVGNGGVLGTFAVMAEIVAFLVGVWTLFTIVRDRKRSSEVDIGGVIYKAVMRILGPVFNRIRKKSERKTHLVKGSDKREFIRGGIFTREKKGRVKRQKINIDREKENVARLRLIYIKYVLGTAERGVGITYAHTPYEIEKLSGRQDDGALFDVYTRVRYGEVPSVSDAELSSCMDIAERS